MKLLPTVLVLALAGPALAQDPKPSPPPAPRTEITVYAGASLLDVTSQSVRSFPIPVPLPFPVSLPVALPVGGFDLRSSVSLSGSALFGFKVARSIGRRARLELDFAMAPGHELETGFGLECGGRPCFEAVGFDRPFTTSRTVPAYQYGLGVAYDLTRGDVRPYLIVGVGGVSYDTPDAFETSFAVTVGAGARMFFGEKTGIRLEVVDRIVTDSFVTGGVENDLQVVAGFLIRLP